MSLVLVAPVWMSKLAGPMRSFVAARAKTLPPLAVVSVMGHAGAYGAVAEITKLAGRAPLLSTAILARNVEDGRCAPMLHAFGDSVRGAQATPGVARPSMWSAEAA